MRTTIDLPDDLVKEALGLTHARTKTALLITALENLIQKEKIKGLKEYFGKMELDIDLNVLRKR